MNRQLNGSSSLTIETVVAICRAYALDMAETFVGVGFITPDEAEHLGRGHGLLEYSDLDLAREIVRRIEANEATTALTDPIDVGGHSEAEVPSRPTVTAAMGEIHREERDDLAARREYQEELERVRVAEELTEVPEILTTADQLRAAKAKSPDRGEAPESP